jgi:murein DD-endopeptidase MepM/ murein hydrolase activator NlpD
MIRQRWPEVGIETEIWPMDEVTVKAVQQYLTRGFELMNEATAQFQHAAAVWSGMGGTGAQPERVLFASPVTGKVGDVFGPGWFSAVSYAEKYGTLNHYHTGVDLNLPGFADAGKPVYCAADGELVWYSAVSGWQGKVACVRHVLDGGLMVFTRYAHINTLNGLMVGQHIARGVQLGTIADYTPIGKPEGDHLHYDIAYIDLGRKPDDWPGVTLARVTNDYIDPVKWHKARAQ